MARILAGRSSRWLLVVVLAALALSAVPWLGSGRVLAMASPASPPLPKEFELTADSIEHSLDDNLITATGQVDLRLTDLEAQGEQLQADLERQVVEMAGPVTLQTPSGTLTGKNLQYAWDSRHGSVANARTLSQGVILTSQAAEISPETWVFDQSLVTKCNLPTPEYAFLAKTLVVDPQTQLARARGVHLALFGYTIMPLPDMRFSLKNTEVGRMSRSRLPMPQVGYDSTRGYFLSDEFPVHLSDRDIILAGGGYGTREGGRLTLSGLYQPADETTYRLDAVWRQHSPAQTADSSASAPSDLDGTFRAATSTPAGRLTFTLSQENDPDHGNRDLAYAGAQLAPRSTRLAGLLITPYLEWANIREEASGRETTRGLARLSWSAAPHVPGPFTLSLSGMASQATYGTDERLTAETLSAVVSHPLGSTLSLRTQYNFHGYTGTTPFLFDAPDRYSEGELGLAWQEGPNTAAVSAVYDLSSLGTAQSLTSPAALKLTAALDTARWRVATNIRYDLGTDPHYETLSYELVRKLHCFDLRLKGDLLTQGFSLGLVLR